MLAILISLMVGIQDAGPPEGPPASPRALSAAEVAERRANGQSVDLAPLRPDLGSAVPVFSQVRPHWRPLCDNPRAAAARVACDVTLDSEGRIIDGPTPVRPEDDPDWRLAAEAARAALVEAAPFDTPSGFRGGRYRPTFVAARLCASLPDQP